MAGVNRIMLLGNLGDNPVLRYTQNGTPVANFSLATNEEFQNAAGDRVRSTEWHRIVCWKKTAENCAQYLTKGRQVYVEGKVKSRSYMDKDDIERIVHEVIALNVQFLGPKPENSVKPKTQKEVDQELGAPPPDDDIPF